MKLLIYLNILINLNYLICLIHSKRIRSSSSSSTSISTSSSTLTTNSLSSLLTSSLSSSISTNFNSISSITNSNTPIHLVFIGDSVLRYGYLDFIYRIHFHEAPPKNFTFNDHSTRLKWTTYLSLTTDIFQGSMICDCYRGEIMGKSDDIFETRYYRHPSGKFYATYYQKWGNVPVYGKNDFKEMKVYNNLAEAQKNTWIASTFADLITYHLLPLYPPATAVILNQRFWVTPFRKAINITPEMAPMMKVLLNYVDHVLWLEGTPTQSEAKQKQQDFNPLDHYMKSRLCNISNPEHIERSSTEPSLTPIKPFSTPYPLLPQNIPLTQTQQNQIKPKSRDSNQHISCKFVPFPSKLRKNLENNPDIYYADGYHFIDNELYHIRLSEALKTIGLEDIYNLPLPQHHTHPPK